uniref:Uncharacterized protein n=1 Tax=Romanomermis culicivorax TaxID=13658 RepID=A0A915KBP1_ROMCU
MSVKELENVTEGKKPTRKFKKSKIFYTQAPPTRLKNHASQTWLRPLTPQSDHRRAGPQNVHAGRMAVAQRRVQANVDQLTAPHVLLLGGHVRKYDPLTVDAPIFTKLADVLFAVIRETQQPQDAARHANLESCQRLEPPTLAKGGRDQKENWEVTRQQELAPPIWRVEPEAVKIREKWAAVRE